MARQKHRSAKLYGAVALCAPAVRLVVVQVWAEVGESDEVVARSHVFHPVVAIRARVEHDYSIYLDPGEDSRRRGRTHRDMESLGWHYEGSHVTESCLVVNEEFDDLGDLEDLSILNGRSTVVACPWDPREDDERLKSAVEALHAENDEFLISRHRQEREKTGGE